MKKKFIIATMLLLLIISFYLYNNGVFSNSPASQSTQIDYILEVPSDRFPKTAAHIKSAIKHGESSTCTIDRKDADEHRKQSLKGVPTKKGYDRDEWPMAMCAEGGTGADIEYVEPKDNRGAGSWISNQLEKYPDGTKVMVIVK